MMKKILGFIGIAALVAGAVLGVIYFLKRRSEQAERDNFNLDDYDFEDCCDCDCDCDDDCTCGCKEGKPCTCHGDCKSNDDCDDSCDCGCKDE